MGARSFQENGLTAQAPQNGDQDEFSRTSIRKVSLNGDAAALHQHYSVKTKEIKTFQPSCSRGNRTRYFLKSRGGCNYLYCTYCTIPFAEGNSRNPSVRGLSLDVSRRAEGGKEIVITGVNIGDFGSDYHERFIRPCRGNRVR